VYICKKCKRTFENPCNEYDDIGYRYSVCPYCEDDRIEDATTCEQCSDPKARDGEDYCDSCKEQVKLEIYRFISDMVLKGVWDRELVEEMMSEVLEESDRND
jgi:DNA-directed RNA polymerase subunit RPC12/RpoP